MTASTEFTHPPLLPAAVAGARVPPEQGSGLQGAGRTTPPPPPRRAAGATLSRRQRAQQIRAARLDTYDEATHWGARTLRTYTFIGFGFFVTLGLTGIAQPGFATIGKVCLIAAGIFAFVFLINLPRLYWQERLYDNRRRMDSEFARAVAAALAEGDDRAAQEAAA